MAKTIGKLIEDYTRANNDRHNLYVMRSKYSKQNKTWTTEHEERLVKAREKKIAVSKKLRSAMKKQGLVIHWGTRNQVMDIGLMSDRIADRKRRREYIGDMKLSNFTYALVKVDLA